MLVTKYINPLENIIANIIIKNSFMTIEEFINISLNHPEYGYYVNNSPIGLNNDFITSPEISQLFGEMLGFWLINHWQQLNEPYINLIELGPGKGTLMLDLINIVKKIPKLNNRIKIYLVEINKKLILKQKILLEKVQEYNIEIKWLKDIYQAKEVVISNNNPVIVIANEFLDVLPIKQYKYINSHWHEVVIALRNSNNSKALFSLALDKNPTNIEHILPKNFNPKNDMIFEYSPLAIHYINIIAELILQNKGAAVFIDYGYIINQYTNTIQAIKNHKHTNFLTNIGKNDITALVNFPLLINQLKDMNLKTNITTQELFLTNLGILTRMNILLKVAEYKQINAITSGVERILDKNNMGSLFKVLEISSN